TSVLSWFSAFQAKAMSFPSGEKAGVSFPPSELVKGTTLGWSRATLEFLEEYNHPAAPLMMIAATSAAPAKRHRGCVARVEPAVSAATKAPAVANRSAGAFASALVTAASTAGETRRTVPRCGMGSVKRLAMIACAVGPV